MLPESSLQTTNSTLKTVQPPVQPKRATQSQFKLWAWTLMLIITGIGIVPIAKAAPLDELTGTLQQTVTDVTQKALNPIGQIQQQIGDTVGGLTRPLENLGNFGNIFGGGNPIGNLLNPFTQQISQYFQVFNDFINRSMSNIFGDVLGGIFGNGTNSANGTGDNGDSSPTGALGLPDFEAVHQQIEQQTVDGGANGAANAQMQKVDQFNLNPLVLAQSVKSETDRTMNRGMASSVVGKAGQNAMVQELQGAGQTLQTIQSKAQEAQGKDVTQDVMKDLVTLQAGQSALQGGAYTNLMLLRQQTAANSLVMSNISDAVDETNRMQHSEKIAGAVSLIQASGSVYLPGATGNQTNGNP
ncbi:hypothetical protein JOY44_25585 (plasmid) [Phormidium sp. CLA17]|uniref:hypothetical protein n=1 Tax=Leptolyngbya sp. Cla-17 TaxID=2803751 RepID=UPI00183AF5D6|nr:hypothetical protein [Leptolyngbya sp. Cla-17]MBM0744894.1 hypothetical protein [Leptolyngbya sp. Cla-17]